MPLPAPPHLPCLILLSVLPHAYPTWQWVYWRSLSLAQRTAQHSVSQQDTAQQQGEVKIGPIQDVTEAVARMEQPSHGSPQKGPELSGAAGPNDVEAETGQDVTEAVVRMEPLPYGSMQCLFVHVPGLSDTHTLQHLHAFVAALLEAVRVLS